MVRMDDDLGLSLTLGSSTSIINQSLSQSQIHKADTPLPFQLNLMMSVQSTSNSTSSAAVSYSLPQHNQFAAGSVHKSTTPSWTMDGSSNPFHLFSVDRFSNGTRQSPTTTVTDHHQTFLKAIDVNRLPPSNNNVVTDEDEAGGVSSPNSTLSSVGGKRCEREHEHAAGVSGGSGGDDERGCSGGSDDEDGDTARKKLRLSKNQSAVLEDSFKEHNTLNPKQKLALAKRLGLRPRQVEVWFQNRRARTKLKQTEVDCEFLRRCCEQLTEDNRRLHKEVQELRAVKLSPQFYMQMTPATTLTMCPSCERVGGGSGSGSGSNKVNNTSRPIDATTTARHQNHQYRAMNPWGVTPGSSVPISNSRSFEPLIGRS